MKKIIRSLSLTLILSLLCQLILPLGINAAGSDYVIKLEAESIDLTSGFNKVADADASGGYVYSSKVSNRPSQGVPSASTEGALEYTFKISK